MCVFTVVAAPESPRSSPSPSSSASNSDHDGDDDDDDDNFATVDWLAGQEHDLMGYHAVMEALPTHSSQFPWLQQAGRRYAVLCHSYLIYTYRVFLRLLEQGWRGCQGWLICALVGGFTGLLASMIDMCVHWVIDVRQGRCLDSWFLSNLVCCSAIDNSLPPSCGARAGQCTCTHLRCLSM